MTTLGSHASGHVLFLPEGNAGIIGALGPSASKFGAIKGGKTLQLLRRFVPSQRAKILTRALNIEGIYFGVCGQFRLSYPSVIIDWK